MKEFLKRNVFKKPTFQWFLFWVLMALVGVITSIKLLYNLLLWFTVEYGVAGWVKIILMTIGMYALTRKIKVNRWF